MDSRSYVVRPLKGIEGNVLFYQFLDKRGIVIRSSCNLSELLAFADGYTLALNENFINYTYNVL